MPQIPYINRLYRGWECSFQDAGGKAFNLQKLINAGFPVPNTYYISSKALADAIKSSPSAGEMIKCLADSNPSDLSGILQKIRKETESLQLPIQLEQEIESVVTEKGEGCLFAIRSSASAEDLPDASFAGQYESYLNVCGKDEIIKKVKLCAASVWTERAYDYRKKRNIPEESVAMAVIIQEMVQADYSGVIFTADPVSGNKKRIIIEAVRGLGDDLVSGRAVPLRADFDRDEDISRIKGENNPDLPMAPDLVKKLVKTALSIEELFDSPQDIEWAVGGDDIVILQARNITTAAEQENNEGDVWSSVNVGELMPGVLTPLAFSIAGESVRGLFLFVAKILKIDFSSQPFMAMAAGRAYANVTVFTRLMTCLPGLGKMELRDSFGGMQSRHSTNSPLPENVIEMLPKGKALSAEEKARRRKASLSATLAMPGIIAKLVFNLIFVDEDKFLRKMRSDVDEAMRRDIESLSDDELYSIITKTVGGAMEGSNLLMQVAGMGMGLSTTLFQLCEKWLSDDTGSIANRLLAGCADMESANGAMEIWNLAEAACINEKVKEILMNGAYQDVMDKIAGIEGGDSFIKLWDAFMFNHGHHARGEVNIYIPRWSEEPDYVMDLVRNCIRSMDRHNPVKVREARAEEREALLSECLGKIRNPINRYIFKIVTSKSRKGLELRENLKSQWMRAFRPLRGAIIETGKRLSERQKIEEVNDVFFLYLPELCKVMKDDLKMDVKLLIQERKKAFRDYENLTPMPVITGKYNPDDLTITGWEKSPLQLIQASEPVAESDGGNRCHILKGIAVCPGVVEGPARVILSADDHELILPGEILIAPYTDPGWTPYFLTAAALVTDMGGMLSHGSIVAREYGIPAVVNTASATKLIKTGQKVKVDGTGGKVYVYGDECR